MFVYRKSYVHQYSHGTDLLCVSLMSYQYVFDLCVKSCYPVFIFQQQKQLPANHIQPISPRYQPLPYCQTVKLEEFCLVAVSLVWGIPLNDILLLKCLEHTFAYLNLQYANNTKSSSLRSAKSSSLRTDRQAKVHPRF